MKGDSEEKKKRLYLSFRTLICTSDVYKAFDSVILASNHLFNLPIVDFYLPFIRN